MLFTCYIYSKIQAKINNAKTENETIKKAIFDVESLINIPGGVSNAEEFKKIFEKKSNKLFKLLNNLINE